MEQKDLLDQLKKDFAQICKNHNDTGHSDGSVDEYDHTFTITAMDCNVPLLSDVRMLADAYGLSSDNVESDDGWGYVGINFKPRFLFPKEEKEYYLSEGMTIDEFNEQTQVLKEPDKHLRELCGATR